MPPPDIDWQRLGSKIAVVDQAGSFPHQTAGDPPKHRPIRVVHVAQSIAGGIASFFEEIASYQNKAFGRENVTFVIPSGSEVHLPSIDRAQIVTFAATSRGPRALVSFGRSAIQVIHQLQPDIVHLHSSFAGALVRPLLVRRRGKPRIVYCPHGWAFGIECAGIKKRIYAAIERGLARLTDLIIVNSESEYHLAIRSGLAGEKIRVVRNGVAWLPVARHAVTAGRLRVAFIGRHDRQKGLDVLLDAIERFPLDNIQFDVVGDAVLNPESEKHLDGIANLKIHGWLDRKAVTGLLSHVDAVVMPSRWEAFGLVAIEAMRAGVPVIASNKGALPEIVQHGVTGYIFDLDDPDALGLLLTRLHRKALRKLRRSARARWESEFSAARMNELTAQAYVSLLPFGTGGDSTVRGVVSGRAAMHLPG